MKLKTYAETEQMYKDKFYTQWYGGLKDKVVDFIKNNFIDIEGFNIYFPYDLIYKVQIIERIWWFKFLRSELWEMGFNLMKEEGHDYRLFKRKKEDKYSKFLMYPNCNLSHYIIINEISYIQMITGKTYDEARKILNAAIGVRPNKEENKNVAINVANITTNVKEESAVPTDVTEAIEQTLATDDSE